MQQVKTSIQRGLCTDAQISTGVVSGAASAAKALGDVVHVDGLLVLLLQLRRLLLLSIVLGEVRNVLGMREILFLRVYTSTSQWLLGAKMINARSRK